MSEMKRGPDVIILGGGLTGLAAAWKLARSGAKVTVIEAMEQVGGLAASFSWRGFTLDLGPHKLYPQSDKIRSFLPALLGEDLVKQEKRAGIWLRGQKLVFPPSITSGFADPGLVLSGFFGYLRAVASNRIKPRVEVSYEDYIVNRFGRALYEKVFRPQATKLWGPPAELSAELGRIRMPFPSLFEVISGIMLESRLGPEVSAKEFYYPKQGIGELAARLAKGVLDGGGKILLGCKPTVVRPTNDGVAIESHDWKLSADVVISTIALESLVGVMQPKVPALILAAAGKLKFRSLILSYLCLGRPRLGDDHWIVFPEQRYCFNRIYEARAFGIEGKRAGETVIAAEVTVDCQELWDRTDAEIAKSVVSDLTSTRLIKNDDVLAYKIIRVKRAYPLLDLGFDHRRRLVLSYIHEQPNILSSGRSGLFIYNNMDHSLEMGLAAAEHILNGSIESWPLACGRFEGIRIID